MSVSADRGRQGCPCPSSSLGLPLSYKPGGLHVKNIILKQMCAVKLTILAYLLKLDMIFAVLSLPKRDSSLSISDTGMNVLLVGKKPMIWSFDP